MQDIFQASRSGNIKRVLELLNSGININLQDGKGWTPLHCAAHEGHLDIAEILIMRGADVNKKTDRGATSLMLAAMRRDGLEIVKLLLKQNAEINARCIYRSTALHEAVRFNNYYTVKLLLEKKADYNISDDSHRYPESYALRGDVLNLFEETRKLDTHQNGLKMVAVIKTGP